MASQPSSPEGPASDANESSTSSEHKVTQNGQCGGNIDVSAEKPSAEDIKKVEDLPILDVEGKTHPFKSLYTSELGFKRVLILFIRHFFCGVRIPHYHIAHNHVSDRLTDLLVRIELSRIHPHSRRVSHPRISVVIPNTYLSRHHRLRPTRPNTHVRRNHLVPLSNLRRPHAQTLRHTRHVAHARTRAASP